MSAEISQPAEVSRLQRLLATRVSRRALLNGAATALAVGAVAETAHTIHDENQIANSSYVQLARKEEQESPMFPPNYDQIIQNQLEDNAHILERKAGVFLAAFGSIFTFTKVNDRGQKAVEIEATQALTSPPSPNEKLEQLEL